LENYSVIQWVAKKVQMTAMNSESLVSKMVEMMDA
jgi:hypothetical protein